MKKSTFSSIVVIVMGLLTGLIAACGQQTPEQKIKAQTQDKVHALSADERQRATINAKGFFEKEWRTASGAMERGMVNECRPSDSNFNGLVSCTGQIPNMNGGWKEVKRYCGYTPELVGCSDEDTVK